MRSSSAVSEVISRASVALMAMMLVACGRPAEAPTAPPTPTPTADVATTAPTPEGPRRAWLVWRQDVGGLGVTSLVEETSAGSPEPWTALSVGYNLLVWGAGDVWSLGPVTERWPLKPCGDDAVGITMGLRYQKLGLATKDGVPGDVTTHLWTTAETRPQEDESGMHDESLAFIAQVRDLVFVSHVTTSGTCPVPDAGLDTQVEIVVLDLATKTLRQPMSLLAEDEKVAVEKSLKRTAVAKLAQTRPDLSPAVLNEQLALSGLSVTRNAAGALVMTYRFSGEADAFRPVGDVLGRPGPFVLTVDVVGDSVPRVLRDAQGGMPDPVVSFLSAAQEEDKPRIENFPNAALYGGSGWSVVPPELVEDIRKKLNDLHDAPTPTGPTDWD